MSKVLWISRDDVRKSYVHLWKSRPLKRFNDNGDVIYEPKIFSHHLEAYCPEMFISVTGIAIDEGEEKKVKMVEVKHRR